MKNLDTLRKLQASGIKVPTLENLPEILPQSRIFWEAWLSLSPRRMRGPRGPQPLQLSEIIAYCEIVGHTDPDERLDMARLLGAMDRMYIEHHYDKP